MFRLLARCFEKSSKKPSNEPTEAWLRNHPHLLAGNNDDMRMTRIESFDESAAPASNDESAEDWGGQTRLFGHDAPVGVAAARPDVDLSSVTTRPYRPTSRPPVAVLLVADDGGARGQEIRLRSPRFVIGRDQGDLTLPEDLQISGRHAEIERRETPQGYRWLLRDLQSRNGTFVRTDYVRMKQGDELLLGRRRMLFENGPPATLRELAGPTVGQRLPLGGPLWIGRAAECPAMFRQDDLLEQKHASIVQKGDRWCLHAEKSLNGTWVRVAEVFLVHGCWFQVGEQQLRIFFP